MKVYLDPQIKMSAVFKKRGKRIVSMLNKTAKQIKDLNRGLTKVEKKLAKVDA